jgi:predicted nucleic acid-binding protein
MADIWSYLIDTNIIAESIKDRPNEGVLEWMSSVAPEECRLSVITLAELRRGIVHLEARSGGAAKVARIAQWLESVTDLYQGRVLNVTPAVAHAWAHLPIGRTLPKFDSLIAATAIAHDLAVVTHNVKDFEGIGVRLLDPYRA